MVWKTTIAAAGGDRGLYALNHITLAYRNASFVDYHNTDNSATLLAEIQTDLLGRLNLRPFSLGRSAAEAAPL
jgi:hypothetical protein